MKNTYLNTPKAAIALNFKVGSSTLSRAVISAYHPDLESLINSPPGDGNGTAYPQGKSSNDTRWHFLCPKVNPQDRPVTLLAVRDPIEKFRSACAESRIDDVDAKLSDLETHGFQRDVHFWPQSRLLHGTTKLYVFPEHLNMLATEAGLSLPLPDIDGGHNYPKPDLTPEQVERVKNIYSEDITLLDSITEAGIVRKIDLPTTPDPVPSPVARLPFRNALLSEFGITFAGIRGVLDSMPDGVDKETAIIQLEEASEVHRDNPLVEQIRVILGKTPEETDELFRVAGTPV